MELQRSHMVMAIIGVTIATIVISYYQSVRAGVGAGLFYATISILYLDKFGIPEPVKE